MADSRYVEFIEKIIVRTKNNRLKWRYLDTKEELYEGMGWTKTETEYVIFGGNKEITIPNFNVEDSFYTNIDNMYIVVYVWMDQPAELYIIPNTYKKVTILTPDEYGEHITRLLNIVQSQFPNAESFIDSFLKNENDKKSD